jgi:hypothetical protein
MRRWWEHGVLSGTIDVELPTLLRTRHRWADGSVRTACWFIDYRPSSLCAHPFASPSREVTRVSLWLHRLKDTEAFPDVGDR